MNADAVLLTIAVSEQAPRMLRRTGSKERMRPTCMRVGQRFKRVNDGSGMRR